MKSINAPFRKSFLKQIFCLFFLNPFPIQCANFENGKQLFFTHCVVCHNEGNNIIIPEKNLKKNTLDANGMNTVNSIMYQVMNGKNGMPAFGGRLIEAEIEDLATFVLKESSTNFLEN